MSAYLPVLWNLLVAALSGLAVGIEREWSGHSIGPRARFAGVRTFTLLAIVSGLSGWLWTLGLQGPALVFLAGLGGLVIVAYVAASRRDVDGTTEVAAFVVMAAGVLAGAGYAAVASAITAITVLLLVEKKQLHGLVSKLDRVEIRAGARFAVMAVVILPLLPQGPFGPWDAVKPRQLWALVLFFSGLSFVGYAVRRAFGRNRGYAIAGILGGIVSSTATTFTFARTSRHTPATTGPALAAGVLGANAVVFPRVLIACVVLAPALAAAVWPGFVAPVVIGGILSLRGLRDTSATPHGDRSGNPLQFKNALQMALIFQVVVFAVSYARQRFGQQGILGSAYILGAFDVDALTMSMAQLTRSGTAPELAARAVIIGILANTIVKLTIALALGRGRFRPLAAIGLALMAVVLGAWIYFFSVA